MRAYGARNEPSGSGYEVPSRVGRAPRTGPLVPGAASWIVATALVLGTAGTARANPDDDLDAGLKSVATMREVGETVAAAAAAAELAAKHPESIEAQIVHQDLELALGHDKDLVAAYRAAATLPGATADTHFLLGRILRGAAATGEYREALKSDPAHFWAACNLAIELTRSKAITEARTLLEDAAKRRPTSAVPVTRSGGSRIRAGSTPRRRSTTGRRWRSIPT